MFFVEHIRRIFKQVALNKFHSDTASMDTVSAAAWAHHRYPVNIGRQGDSAWRVAGK
jgi:hypothetical protein